MATPYPPYPHPPPQGFQQPPFPPFPPQGQPMMMNMGMHPPPPGIYGGYPNQGPPMMGGPMPMGMGPPGSGGSGAPPNAFYAQQVPPTAFPLGGGGFHSVPMGDASTDYEAGKTPGDPGFEFTDKSIRRAFIRKVYSILSVQLLVTMGIIAVFIFTPGVKPWLRENRYLFYVAIGITFVTMLAMACCESVRRRSPQNIICLSVFTLAEGFVLGAAASTYDKSIVMLAVAITAAVCGALTLFSFQTKFDMTAHGGIMCAAGVVLCIFGFLMIFLRNKFPILHLVYACIGALIFSAYLVYDTQLMMGGNHKCAISPEDYIFAALNIYMDIVNIFIYMLTILSSFRGDD